MNIWVRDLQSGVDRQVTRGAAAAMQAAWSPDGSRIAFSDPEGQIQVVDVKSGAITKMHDRLNEAGRASWSPDGNALVVSSLKVYSTRFREGTNQVLKISLDGQPDRWFDPMPHKSVGMREDYGPVWSPDGAQMAAIIDGLLTVWPVSRDGTPQASPRPLSTELAGSPTWTRDSRRILYQSGQPPEAGRRRVRTCRAGDRSAPHLDAVFQSRRHEDDSRRPFVERPHRTPKGRPSTTLRTSTSSSMATASRASSRIETRCTAAPLWTHRTRRSFPV